MTADLCRRHLLYWAGPAGGIGEVHVLHQTKIQQTPRRKFAVHEIARPWTCRLAR